MNVMALLQQPLMTALGWALVHFLWQGVLIALLLAAANAALHKAGPRARYALACGAMILMVISAAGTFLWLAFAGTAATGTSAPIRSELVSAAAAAATPEPAGFQLRLAGLLPWLDCLWLAGVLGLSLRSIVGWSSAQRLKRADTSPADPVWEQHLDRLSRVLRVSGPVRLAKSALAGTPSVIGWLKPVILVPAAAFARMDPEQLEALLAHELAHIRRHDYIVNLIQSAAETLLFYHPAVWRVSRKIRIERENCCDDLAVSVCGDVVTYARALTRLEELRTGGSQFAMAADAGSLLTRVRRLLEPGRPARRPGTWFTALLAALALCAIWGGAEVSLSKQSRAAEAVPRSAPEDARAHAVPAGTEHDAQAASAPARKTATASKPQATGSSGSYIQDLADAGYPNLTVDQLIAFKIHGVAADYIRQLRAAGVDKLSPDQLVAFRIHGADAGQIELLKSAGFAALSPDQIVAFRIHGITPEYARSTKDLKLGEASADQLVAMKIHNVTPEFCREIQGLGLKGLTLNGLVAFRIHNVEAAQVRELQSLGLGELTPDQVVALRIHNVTPEFVRSLKDAGLTKLSCDDAVAARIHGITPAFIEEAGKHGFKDQTVDQLIRLKQSGVL
jgi:beta-lactamase regulating signal transducer with metallopeptidase domain